MWKEKKTHRIFNCKLTYSLAPYGFLTLPTLCVIGGAPHLFKIPKSSLPVTVGVNTDFSCYSTNVLLEYSFSSANIVLNMIKFLCLKSFVFSLVLLIYSQFISIGMYTANMFERRTPRNHVYIIMTPLNPIFM